MNLYLVRQDINNGYDTYDMFVCAAPTEEIARHIHPNNDATWTGEHWTFSQDTWVCPDQVEVMHIGISNTTIQGVVCASFNAG